MSNFFRLASAAGMAVALTACGGGGGIGSVFNPNPISSTVPQCNIGTSVTTSNPQSGAYGVPTTIGSIEIVTDGNSNAVSQNPSGWTLALQTSYGAPVPVNGNLNVTSDPYGYHPYPQDFYYNETIPQLQPGQSYNVYLEPVGYGYNGTPNCMLQIGSFST